MSEMTPREVVQELDKHIVGQTDAKRAVAIALRNRWRRLQLEESLSNEITPKNILMIGPTGVGKTEIARRLAKLAKAPFVKVEATKFTEVGYVGKEVDSIIRDLADAAINQVRANEISKVILPESLSNNGEHFGLKISGDSMIEAGINDGDTVIVKKTNTANNGQIVVALIDDHEAMLKRIRKKGKVVALESANKRYETKIFGPDRVKVQGVLVSLYRNFQ